jgi:hypothetical protein
MPGEKIDEYIFYSNVPKTKTGLLALPEGKA